MAKSHCGRVTADPLLYPFHPRQLNLTMPTGDVRRHFVLKIEDAFERAGRPRDACLPRSRSAIKRQHRRPLGKGDHFHGLPSQSNSCADRSVLIASRHSVRGQAVPRVPGDVCFRRPDRGSQVRCVSAPRRDPTHKLPQDIELSPPAGRRPRPSSRSCRCRASPAMRGRSNRQSATTDAQTRPARKPSRNRAKKSLHY
jgi:hypothetical protein